MPEQSPDAQFAEYFNVLLAQHKLNGADAARRLKVAQSQVSRWKRGEGGISLENLQRIHDVFGTDLTYLMQLAGLRASTPSTANSDPAVEIERQRWRAWFDELREKKVPKSLWTAYTAACEALADSFSTAANAADSALSTDQAKRISAVQPTRPGADEDPPESNNSPLAGLRLALANR